MQTYVFVVSPIIGSAVAGGLSWFFSGAMISTSPFCAASVVAGALVGVLISLGAARKVTREMASLKEAASRIPQVAEKVKGNPTVQDVREMRELVTSLARVLRVAEEVEAARNATLEKAAETAVAVLDEAMQYIEQAERKVVEATKALAVAEEGLKRAADGRN